MKLQGLIPIVKLPAQPATGRIGRSSPVVSAVALALLFAAGCKEDVPTAASSGDKNRPAAAAATGAPDVVELFFVYGSEKKAWLKEAIAAFNKSPEARTDSFQIRIKGQAMGSGSSLTDIAEQAIKPHLWSPSSDVYRRLLSRDWTTREGTVGGTREIAGDSKPLVLSPVVIAMWKPMAEVLGWPDKSIGWSDILALATDSKGWASRGQPDWGLFKLGHTHPEFSNSGLLAVLAEVYAATGKTTGLDRDELGDKKVHAYVQEIESSIVHYGKSTGFFADKMLTRGPSYLSAAVVYENLIIDSYKRPQYRDREMDLVAVYPKEGTFWIDNPLVILDAPWVADRQKQAGRIFRDYLLSKPVQSRAMSEYGFRPSDPSISIEAPIDRAHGVDPKQPKTLLDVPEPAVIDAALEVWKKSKKTVDIMFVFDRSGSMKGKPLREAKQGASDFLDHLDDRDRVSIVMFNHRVPDRIATPSGVGKNRKALKKQIQNTFAEGGTALYDAVAAAYKKLDKEAKTDPRRIFALVVLTDGVDEHSAMSYQQLTARIRPPAEQAVAVKLFTIAYGKRADQKLLDSIAEAGRGAFKSGNTDNIRQIYRDLAAFF
ncbi:MAG: VWA domain-containing protein [Proteobacteria bacterium]|nr:VWA domain-containing protein [Pseudomonadota bacterium]